MNLHDKSDKLPNETWTAVFEDGDLGRRDLYRVVCTCSRFYALGLRPLYTRIAWLDPRHLAANLPFWTTHPSFTKLPRSLDIGCNGAPRLLPSEGSDDEAIDQLNESLAYVGALAPPPYPAPPPPQNPPQRYPIPYPAGQFTFDVRDGVIFWRRLTALEYTSPTRPMSASYTLYQQMLSRITSFVNLDALTFRNCSVPPSFHAMIRSMPRLRCLTLEHVTAMKVYDEPVPSHEGLCLTELTLHGLKSHCCAEEDYRGPLLVLAATRTLQRLSIDSSLGLIHIYRSVFMDSDLPHAAALQLEYLDWRKSPKSHSATEFDLNALLEYTPFLHTLRSETAVVTPFDDLGTMQSTGMTPMLRTFTGWLTAATSVLRYCPCVESLEIIPGRLEDPQHDSTQRELAVQNELAEFYRLLVALREKNGPLPMKCITLPLRVWNEEVLFTVIKAFPELIEWTVTYKQGGPSDDMMIGLGAQFLAELPNLEKLRLYCIDTLEIAISTEDCLDSLSSTSSTPDSDAPPAIQDANHGPVAARLDDEEDVKEYLSAWRRYCKRLREAQLDASGVWCRAYEGDGWVRRQIC